MNSYDIARGAVAIDVFGIGIFAVSTAVDGIVFVFGAAGGTVGVFDVVGVLGVVVDGFFFFEGGFVAVNRGN